MTSGFDLGYDLDQFSSSNMEFIISRPKMVRLPQNKEQTYQFNSKPQTWPEDLTLAMTLILNFQGKILNMLYLSQRWFDCHKMKSMHIEWTEGLNDGRVWPWPWPWKARCKDPPDSDWGYFRCQCAADSSSWITTLECFPVSNELKCWEQ